MLDKKYDQKLTELKNLYYEIEEISGDISDMNEDVYFDEDERNETEERLDLISSLKRKYGNSTSEIIEYRNKLESEIERINNLEEVNKNLKKQMNTISSEMKSIAETMHTIRSEISINLDNKINDELKDLEMPNAKFITKIELNNEFDKNGLDNIQFYIRTNVGEDEKELSKIASGGEMSRIMLAIKQF